MQESGIDLIILDVQMPDMDGISFFIKAREVIPQATRILLTGYADINAAIDAINKGAISKSLVGGDSRPVYAACFPTQFGCTDDVMKYEYDPEKAKSIIEAEGAVDFKDQIDDPHDFRLNLIGATEDMGIVLDEAANTHDAVQ